MTKPRALPYLELDQLIAGYILVTTEAILPHVCVSGLRCNTPCIHNILDSIVLVPSITRMVQLITPVTVHQLLL